MAVRTARGTFRHRNLRCLQINPYTMRTYRKIVDKRLSCLRTIPLPCNEIVRVVDTLYLASVTFSIKRSCLKSSVNMVIELVEMTISTKYSGFDKLNHRFSYLLDSHFFQFFCIFTACLFRFLQSSACFGRRPSCRRHDKRGRFFRHHP